MTTDSDMRQRWLVPSIGEIRARLDEIHAAAKSGSPERLRSAIADAKEHALNDVSYLMGYLAVVQEERNP